MEKQKKTNKVEKVITLKDVINAIKSVEVNLEKKIETSIDELATMVQNNFLRVENRIEKVRSELKSEISSTKTELKSDIADVKVDLNKRVDIFKHNDLKYRVEKVEEKVGVGK